MKQILYLFFAITLLFVGPAAQAYLRPELPLVSDSAGSDGTALPLLCAGAREPAGQRGLTDRDHLDRAQRNVSVSVGSHSGGGLRAHVSSLDRSW